MAMNKQRKSSNLLNILNYDDAGNIVLRDYSQTIRYNWNGTIHAFTGPLSISSIAAAVTDTDRFLVSDGGVLKYRTGAEVLSDIGGVPSTRTLTINGVTQDLSVNRTFTIAAGITGTGADGQVAYWNGTSSQTGSSNLLWDNTNKRLGVGLITSGIWANYTSVLQVGQGFFVDYSPTPQFSIGSNVYYTGSNSLVLRTGGTGILEFTNNGDINLWNGVSQTAGQVLSGTIKMKLFSATGNLVLQNGGTFTDGGQRLQVMGDAFIKGSGATSATSGLIVQNSGGTDLFTINNSGYYRLSGSNGLFISQFTTTQGSASISGTNTQFYNYTTTQAATFGAFSFHGDNFTQTSGAAHTLFVSKAFYPTSGTATHSTLSIAPAINQTGGANGITRGLYVNPTIVAAADWRSIETSTGKVIFNKDNGPATQADYTLMLKGNNPRLRIEAGTTGTSNADGVIQFANSAGDNWIIKSQNANESLVFGYGWNNSIFEVARYSVRSVDPTFSLKASASSTTEVFLAKSFAGSDLFSVRNNGNILVNTGTDAGFKLDVNGTARANSYFTNFGTSSLNLLTSGTTAQTADRGIFIGSGSFNNASVVAVGIGSGVNIGGGTGSVAIGYAANSSGGGVAIGSPSGNGAQSTGGVAISGNSGGTGVAIAGTSGVNAIAIKGTASGNNSIQIGSSGSATGIFSISIGDRSNSAFTSSIAMGLFANTTAANQLVIGGNDVSNGYSINDVYIGGGVQDLNGSNGTSVTINASGGGNTANRSGGTLTIAGGKGTGTGTPGDVVFSTTTATTSGTTLQTLTNRVWIKGDTGNLLIASGTDLGDGAKLQVNGGGRINHLYAHTTGVYTSGLFSFTSVTTATSPSYTSGMFYGAGQSYYRNEFQGSATIPNSVIQSAQFNGTQIRFVNSSTAITMTQGVSSGIRAYASEILQFSFDNAQTACSVSHVAGMQILAPYYQGANNPTITNFYGIVLNDSTEYSGTLSITNRWAIYQDGASDNNYFKGKVVIGSTNTVGVSRLNVKDLPTSASGLATGDVWNNGGVLNIV